MKEALAYASTLLKFIDQSPTAYQAVSNMRQILENQGFKSYQLNQDSKLKIGNRYYYTKNDSAIIAFEIGQNPLETGFKIFGAHTDSPSLRIKPKAISIKEEAIRLNTEVYGGAIYSTWFDRPLSLAGRVSLKGSSPLQVESRFLDFKRPILILPNVAIHMNRAVNSKNEIKANLHLLPIMGMVDSISEEETENIKDNNKEYFWQNWFYQLLAKELEVKPEQILDFDLFTYDPTPGQIVGINSDFITDSRLDNLAMCYAGLMAFLADKENAHFNGINLLIFTDNEEVGSRTKQGADSDFLRDLIESICINLGFSRQDFLSVFDHSYMISADQAHAVHPNYSEYADPDHRPKINGGPVIKLAASQSYATDSHSSAKFIGLCQSANVPYQWFVNRSDLRGGSTIGSITSSHLPMSTVDIGNAIWAMHSSRETAGIKDLIYLDKVLKTYFRL